MPKLTPEALKWFYETQVMIKEKYDLDTTKKEDMGRFRIQRLYDEIDTYAPPEPGSRKKRGKLISTERRPLSRTDPVSKNTKVKTQYAFIKANAEFRDYELPLDEDVDAAYGQALERMCTYNVEKKEDGSLVMHCDLSEEQLMEIFEDAKNGRVYVDAVGDSVTNLNTKSSYFGVNEDFSPSFADMNFSNMAMLDDAAFKEYYLKHPDDLNLKLGDKDVVGRAELEVGSLKNVINREAYRDRIDFIQQVDYGASIGDDDYIPKKEYDVNFWRQVHAGLTPLSYAETRKLSEKMPVALDNAGFEWGFENGEGLEDFYTEDEEGEIVPLFDDIDDETDLAKLKNAVYIRMREAIAKNKLFICARKKNENRTEGYYRIEDNAEKNDFVLKNMERPEPKKPFIKWLLYKLHIFWYRADVESYFEEHRQWERDREIRQNGMQGIIAEKDRKAEEAENEKSPISMSPDELVDRLANGILEERRSLSAVSHYNSLFVTAEDVKGEENFRNFLKTETFTNALKKLVNNEKVKLSNLTAEYLKFDTEKKKPVPKENEKQPVVKKDGIALSAKKD